MLSPVLRQRMVLVFVHDGDEVLLVQRPGRAPSYPGRWTTVSGAIAPGDGVEHAARRALAEELTNDAVIEAAGLYVDFTDTIRKQSVSFRVYPALARAGRPSPAGARWVAPDDVILAAALGETVPELDEALARVWDRAGALPPQFRAEARAILASPAPARELAARAAALVAGGAPPERVAALRPELARVVNAARAAASPERDVAHELGLAARAAARAVAAALERARRPVAVGAVPNDVPAAEIGTLGGADLLLLAAEALLPRGDVVAPAGAVALARAAAVAGIPIAACGDAWATWEDDVPPPLPPELELVPRELVGRVIGLWN
jgi:ADP-ribose pyrophosphatase YjhB (NUDIX family)